MQYESYVALVQSTQLNHTRYRVPGGRARVHSASANIAALPRHGGADEVVRGH